jgi:Rhs element Vgr protein
VLPGGDSSDGGDIEREVDSAIEDAQGYVDDANRAGKNVGEADQDLRRAKEEAQDGDQDTADKGAGIGHAGSDAMRNADEALKDLGILDGNDTRLTDVADTIDDVTESIFGKPHPPDSLPPVRYRVFFGKKDDLMSGLAQMGEGLLSDAMDAGDSFVEQVADGLGVGDYLGTDPFSSVLAKHSPFAEDPKELDRDESPWKLVACMVEEGASCVWRAELVLAAPETRDPALESALDAESAVGGLVDQVLGPIESAKSMIDAVRDVANDSGDSQGLENDEAALAAAEADRDEAYERLDQLEELLAEAQKRRDPPATAAELAALQGRVDDAKADVASKQSAVDAAKRAVAARRAQSRRKRSGAGGIAERASGIADAVSRLGSDPVGALGDILTGTDRGGWPDGPVYVNVPLDPADFLGQTLSLRVSREFTSAPASPQSNDVPGVSFTARYLTGVVTELQDLGVRQPPLPAGATPPPPGSSSRLVRLVLRPELAKLALRRDHRAFNAMSALEIVREVFRSAGIYGLLPDVPGVGAATNFLGGLAEKIPYVGGAVSDAIAGQFIRTIPPAGQRGPMPEREWTQKRELCVQYGETDLDFVRRLLEEEGIHFAFEHRRGFERVVLAHDLAALDQAPTVDGKPAPFFWPSWVSTPNVETVTRFAEQRRLRPGKVTLRDYTFSKADQKPTSRESVDASKAPEADGAYGDRYEYPGSFPYQNSEEEPVHYRDYIDAKDRDYPRLRLEESASAARRIRLHTDLVGVSSSTTLRLRKLPIERDGLPIDTVDATPPADLVVVTGLRWSGGDLGLLSTLRTAFPASAFPLLGTAQSYENEVVGAWLHPADATRTPVRPERRTPKPRITSIQTATVVDHDGDHDEDEAVHRDDPALGRVLVRFHWDRRGELPLGLALPLIGRGTSAFCRVAQPWAGDDFGVLFTPRIGTEVLVAFENGDPDRPYVVGSLYDGLHPVPSPGRETAREGFTPPEARAEELSTLMTRTSPWDDEHGVTHELTFDDTIEKERVLLKSGRYFVEEVRANHSTNVNHDQTNEVRRHHGEIIEKQQELDVRESRQKIVRGDQLVTVRGNRKSTVGDAQTIEILRDHDERVKGVVELKMRGNRTLTVHGDRVTKVGEPGQAAAHDLHEVGGGKRDVVTGKLEVLAGSLALGQPGGAGAGAPAAELGAGPREDGSYALEAFTDEGISLTAAKEVRLESKTDMVDLHFVKSWVARASGGELAIGEAVPGGVRAQSPERVRARAEKSELLVGAAAVELKAEGEETATASVASAGGVALAGATGVVKATVSIASGPGTITKVGS